jgi:hypothetical protein
MSTTQQQWLPPFEVVSYATNKNFFNVISALKIERLQVEVIQYDPQKLIHLQRAVAYLPIGKAKLLCLQVLTPGLVAPGWMLEVFGGGFNEGQIVSRVLKVQFDPGEQNRFGKFPWRVTIASGPGKKTGTGGFSPDGKPTTQVSMRFPADDFVLHCIEIRDFLAAHQHDIEKVRYAEQMKRFRDRQVKQKVKEAKKS